MPLPNLAKNWQAVSSSSSFYLLKSSSLTPLPLPAPEQPPTPPPAFVFGIVSVELWDFFEQLVLVLAGLRQILGYHRVFYLGLWCWGKRGPSSSLSLPLPLTLPLSVLFFIISRCSIK
ncbi:hypothetical protein NMG60_11015992 [Bertholletia excelsa]